MMSETRDSFRDRIRADAGRDLAGYVQPSPGARPVATEDGRVVPSNFVVSFPGLGDLRVYVGEDRRPCVIELRIAPDEWLKRDDDPAAEITPAMLRSIKLPQLLAEAVEMAHVATTDSVTRLFADQLPEHARPVKGRGRRRLTDAQVQEFVDAFRATDSRASIADRAKAIGYGRAAVYRMRDEARQRGIISEGEEL